MWPLIDDKEGDWYPADVSEKSVEGMEGYRVRPQAAAGPGLRVLAGSASVPAGLLTLCPPLSSPLDWLVDCRCFSRWD